MYGIHKWYDAWLSNCLFFAPKSWRAIDISGGLFVRLEESGLHYGSCSSSSRNLFSGSRVQCVQRTTLFTGSAINLFPRPQLAIPSSRPEHFVSRYTWNYPRTYFKIYRPRLLFSPSQSMSSSRRSTFLQAHDAARWLPGCGYVCYDERSRSSERGRDKSYKHKGSNKRITLRRYGKAPRTCTDGLLLWCHREVLRSEVKAQNLPGLVERGTQSFSAT